MILKQILYVILTVLVLTTNSWAIAPSDYEDRFIVDMNEQIPPVLELRKKYSPPPSYDRKFDYYWNIGTRFDRSFGKTIKSYGTREARIKWDNEDALVKTFKNMPAEYYPYLGPYLHTVPGIPAKVLNLPGIKETKNKFPDVIAKKLENIENIEFLSPIFYFVLMPEIWGEKDNIEKIKSITVEPTNRYDAQYLDNLVDIVPPQNFAPGAIVEQSLESSLRTIFPDASSPLTTRDIQAVANTLHDIAEFSNNLYNRALVSEAGSLLDIWENANNKGTILPMLKDLVHPCQRLVQKLKMQGLEKEFSYIIAKEGFELDEWAYTCDKTIKAYRVLNMTKLELLTLKLYKRNIYQNQLFAYDEEIGPRIAITMQSMIEMYKASTEDVLEVKRNQKELKKSFEKLKYRIVGQPINIK